MTLVMLAASLAVAVGLAAGIRLILIQDRLVFRPPAMGRATPSTDAELHRLDTDSGPVTAWWIPAPGEDVGGGPVVLFFHGSDSHLAAETPTLRFLRGLGVAVLAVEYPGYEPGGHRPTEPGCYQAAEAAWRWLVDDRRVEPGRIVVFGVSLGSAVAVHLAATAGCGGVALHSAFTSVPDLAAERYPWLPVRPFVRTRMDSLSRIGEVGAPVLLVHSRDDEHIPYRHALRLYEAAQQPKRLVTIEGPHFGNPRHRSTEVRTAWEVLLAAASDTGSPAAGDGGGGRGAG